MALFKVPQAEKHSVSKTAFMDHAYFCLGGGLDGITRYGAVILQAQASNSPAVFAALERFKYASSLERDNTALFLDILVADNGNDLTQAERDAIINGWPS